MNKPTNKVPQQKNFILKVNPGTYGKGGNQVTADDIVEVKANEKIPSIAFITPLQIYHRKKTKRLRQDVLLNVLFLVCSLLLIALKFFVNDFFTSTKEKSLETLMSNLCFAFIASYIFYNVVTKRTEKIRKREAYAIICGLTTSLINNGKKVPELISKGANKDDSYQTLNSLDENNFRKLCEETDITKILDGTRISEDLISNGVKQISFYISKIYQYMPFLDSELLHHLNKIQHCKFSRFIVLAPHKQNNDLREFTKDIREFMNYLNELESFNSKLKKKYLKGYELRY